MDEQGIITGTVPFILSQKWAFTTTLGRYMYMLLEYESKIDSDILAQTIRHMQMRHDILRTRVIEGLDGWQQIIPYPDEYVPLTWVSLPVQSEQDHESIIRQTAISLFEELDKYEGPLLRFVQFTREGEKSDLLLVVMHHLIADYYSSVIFFTNFSKIYENIRTGKPALIGPKPSSFKHFAEELMRYTESHLVREFKDYWSSLPWEKARPFPADYSEEHILYAEEAWSYVKGVWTPEETSELTKIVVSARLPLLDVLLAALALTIKQWTNAHFVHIASTNVGRVLFGNILKINLVNTMGYISINQRFFLDMSNISSPENAWPAIKKEIDNIPYQGIGCDILYFCSNYKYITDILSRHASEQAVLFNFAGRVAREELRKSSLWKPAREYHHINFDFWKSPLPSKAENLGLNFPSRTFHRIYWRGEIMDNQLQFFLVFDTNIYKRTTVEHIYQDFKRNLRALMSIDNKY